MLFKFSEFLMLEKAHIHQDIDRLSELIFKDINSIGEYKFKNL